MQLGVQYIVVKNSQIGGFEDRKMHVRDVDLVSQHQGRNEPCFNLRRRVAQVCKADTRRVDRVLSPLCQRT